MVTINTTLKTKNEFEKERFNLRMDKEVLISQDEFIRRLLVCWRENGK